MKRYTKYVVIILTILAFCISICFIPIDATRFIPIVQKETEQELGVKVHIEKLIFRFGPSLKIKAPIMHLLYEDGKKFGQLDNVKFYVPWSTLFKDNIYVKKIYADSLILRIDSGDGYLNKLLEKFKSLPYEMCPNVQLNKYAVSYVLAKENKQYELKGSHFELDKVIKYKNLKLGADGTFIINNKPYITYNVSIFPNVELDTNAINGFNFFNFADQIENLDFHSDIIADIKLYNNFNNEMQISGLINIDNISVLDSEKKSPKSFIYLTFLGNKTGILSNIYATKDKKIYAEGVINNSKKAEVDLRVKTDNIQLADAYKKIKPFIDCSKYNNIDSIDGELFADFNIKGNLHKIKSAGFFKVKNASIKANNLNINNINSNIDFSNNIINISNATGYVNNAPIMLKGQIDKDLNIQLLMNKVELKDLLSQEFGIQSGLLSLNAIVSGKPDNITHKENIQIENFKASKNKNTLSFDRLNINTNKDNIAYISNIIFKPEITENIKVPMLRLIIEGDKITIPDTNIFMPNSKIKAKVDITNFNTNNCIFSLFLDGFINSKDLSGITKVSAIYPIKMNISGNNNTQSIDSQLQIPHATVLDEPAMVNLNAKIENESLKIDDLSILPFSGAFSNNLKSNIKGNKKLIISGNIENFKSPSFKNLRIFIPQLLNINAQDTAAQIKGDIFINGKFDQPEIVGQLTISSIINQFIKFSANNLIVDFNKNIAIINAPVVKLVDSSAGINATILTDFSKELFIKNINIKSKYLNTDTFLMYKDMPFSKSYPLVINDGKIYAERVALSLYGSNLYLSALNSDINMKDNILRLKNTSSDLYNGKLAGSIDFNLKDENFVSKLQARGVSAAPIFDIVLPKKDEISGSMDFDANLSGSLLTKQSLNGNIKCIIHNGHMGTIGKLEHLIYAQNVIADNMLRTSLSVITKAITLKDTGLFKYLNTDIDLKNGIAHIKMLQSQGPLMALYMKGEYNPVTDYAKLVIFGRISDEISESLGAFGEFSLNKLMIMLTGEDNKLNIKVDDLEKLPQLPARNTKEFRSVINGIADKPSSVILFNWISQTQKSLRQKEIPSSNDKIPEFIESLPY